MKCFFTLLLFCLSCHCSVLFAQWSMDPMINTPICTSPYKQIDLRMCEDGNGGAYIVWKDYRPTNGLPDIYVQKVDSKGYVKWMIDGLPVCTEQADQSTPAIILCEDKGIIIAWSDWRSSIERDLYIKKLDSNGNVKWTSNGAIVSDQNDREHSEKIVSDGHNGAIVVFEKQSQTTFMWEVWAQRIDSTGSRLWGNGGIPVCTVVVSTRRNHKVQADGKGGAFVCWQDDRSGSYDIFGQHLDANGNRLWFDFGKAMCNAVGDQINAKIEGDSARGGIYVAWQDTRNGPEYDIYVQRIDSNGNGAWLNHGVVVSNAGGNQSALDMNSYDETGDLIITWKDNRNGDYDIYAQKFNWSGAAQWTNNGIVICNAANDQINPNICTDHNNGAIICWQDSSKGDWDIKSQRVSSSGSVLWKLNGEDVCTSPGDQSSVKNVSDAKDGSIFAWQDKRGSGNDIYAHHLFGSGSPNALKDFDFDKVAALYPIPAHHVINLQHNLDQATVVIYNSLGSVVLKQNDVGMRETIDVASLPSGIYMLQLKSQTGLYTKKIEIR